MNETKNIQGMYQTIFEEELSEWYLKYVQIENIIKGMNRRLWFLQTRINLRLEHNSESHQDQNNAEGLVTCVVIFGDWKDGGDIILEDYRVQI